jgi:autotransporter-associated beta strand protein
LSGPGALNLSNATSAPVALNVGNNNSSTTYSGALQGPGGLIKIGTGTLFLSGSDTYTGGTVVNSGVIFVVNAAAIPDYTNLTIGPIAAQYFAPAAKIDGLPATLDVQGNDQVLDVVPEPGDAGAASDRRHCAVSSSAQAIEPIPMVPPPQTLTNARHPQSTTCCPLVARSAVR